jgi:hypothetical protein
MARDATGAMSVVNSFSPGAVAVSADVNENFTDMALEITDSPTFADLARRQSVRAATTADITIATALNSGDTLDGLTLATGDLILVKDQSTASQNGVYEVAATPARSKEFNAYNDHPGAIITVQEGTANAETAWQCTANRGGTLDSTNITFASLFSGVLEADVPANLTAGYSSTSYDLGTITTGTVTPDQDNGHFQHYVNNGAHTLAPQTDNCEIIVQITNGASAVAPTTSGFSARTGDAFTTTSGDDFICWLTTANGFSNLHVVDVS